MTRTDAMANALLQDKRQVIDADLSKHFYTISHIARLTVVAARICDGRLGTNYTGRIS